MKRVKKENKEKIMEMIKKAGSEEYETSWNEEGVPYKIKKKSEVKKGRISKARGARFELKVREDLENKGWIVDKWANNVDLEEGKIVKVKRLFIKRGLGPNLFYRGISTIGTGFPDFIAFKRLDKNYQVRGVEVKVNGILSKIEKEKCRWYLKNKIFSEILIAKQEKEGRKINIKYDNFKERYG